MLIDRDPLRVVLPAFLKQDVLSVYVTTCCGRVYVGPTQATVCRTCKQSPINYEVLTNGSNLDILP